MVSARALFSVCSDRKRGIKETSSRGKGPLYACASSGHLPLARSFSTRYAVMVAWKDPHRCSTRNGGQISSSVKPTLRQLTKRFGAEQARAIRAEGQNSLNWIEEFITTHGINCHFMRNGRFHAAHTPRHFDKLVAEARRLGAEENVPTIIVPRQDQHQELGTNIKYQSPTSHSGV